MENLVNGKTVNLKLVGLDGNALALLGAFAQQARKEGWTPDEISTVRNAATNGDYDNLLRVLMAHCDPDNRNKNSPPCANRTGQEKEVRKWNQKSKHYSTNWRISDLNWTYYD